MTTPILAWRGGVRSVCLCCAMLASAPLAAGAETLTDALNTALAATPEVDIQRARLRELEEGVDQAKASFRPSLSALGSAGVSYFDDADRRGAETRTPLSAGARLAQPIFDSGRSANAVDGALASVEGGRFELFSVEQEAILNTITAYGRVREALKIVALAEATLKGTEETLATTRQRFRLRDVTRTDVAQAEAALALAETDVSERRGRLGQRRHDYRRFVGVAPGELDNLPAPAGLPASLADAEAIALESHPRLMQAKARVEAAGFAVAEAEAGLLPQVELVGEVSARSDAEDRDAGNFSSRAAIELRIPIYEGGALRSQIREAEAAASRTRGELALATREVMNEVGSAWEDLEAARSGAKSSEDRVRAEAEALEGVKAEAKAGARTTFDVLQAERSLLIAREAQVGTEVDLFLSGYRLLAAMGELTAAKLGVAPIASAPEASGVAAAETEDWRHKWKAD